MADETSIYVADTDNYRIVERTIPDLYYVNAISSVLATGNITFDYPNRVASNSTHLFIYDNNNMAIYQLLLSDLSFVNQVDTSSYSVSSLCADENYIYIGDSNLYPYELVRLNVSTLAFVDSSVLYCTGSYGITQIWTIDSMCSDGTYLYINDGWINRFPIANIGDAAPGPEIISHLDAPYTIPWPHTISSGSDGICVSGNYIYLTQPWSNWVYKFDKTDLSFVDWTEHITTTATTTSTPVISPVGWSTVGYLSSAPTGGVFSTSDILTFSPSGATAVCTWYDDFGADPYPSWELGFDTVVGTPTPQDTVSCIATGVSATFEYIGYFVSLDYSGDTLGVSSFDAFMPALENSGYTYLSDISSAPNIIINFFLYAVDDFVFPQNGDTILQYSVVAGSGNTEFDFPMGITSDGTSIYIADSNNARIIKRNNDTLDYESQYVCGTGADYPSDITYSGSNVYVAIPSAGGDLPLRVEQVSVPSLTYVSSISTLTGGLVPTLFGSPQTICNDGTYLYFVANNGADVLYKGTLGSTITNLNNVISVDVSSIYSSPRNMVTDGTLLYYIQDGPLA